MRFPPHPDDDEGCSACGFLDGRCSKQRAGHGGRNSGARGALAACGESASKNTTAANTKAKLPTYVAYTGVKPDLAGNSAGVLPAFYSYPKQPAKAASGVPGHGGSITGFANIYAAVPPPLGRNAYWQQLNKLLGTNLKLNMIPAADFSDKVATVIAGGDLPDLVSLSFSTPNLPALLGSKFANLTEFLSGDAVKQYPFLARRIRGDA